MRNAPALSILCVLLFTLPSLLPNVAALLDRDCDVTQEENIQQHLDALAPYQTLTVCEGTYNEALHITKPINLIGVGDPILDGSLLTGTRHGITLHDGVHDTLIQGFEIRNYDDPLTSTDASSGIVSLGTTWNVTIQDNDIHHNAWTGILAANGTSLDWTITGNKLDAHKFAHAFLQHHANLQITDNTALTSGDHGFILSHTNTALVDENDIHGSGNGAIVITPAIGQRAWTTNATITNNTIRGKWTHGIWNLALESGTIASNTIDTKATGITLGGNLEDIVLHANRYTNSIETENITTPLTTFTEPTTTTSSQGLVDCGLPDPCTTTSISQLLHLTLQLELNPLTQEPTHGDDAAKLAACAGQPDTCLQTSFIDNTDGTTPTTWTTGTITDPLLGAIEIRFIDIAIRQPGADLAHHHQRGNLDQAWTTLILCRITLNNEDRPCDAAPRLFDYGLNLQWATAPNERHASLWHLLQPGSGVHASFDRIHGPDATLQLEPALLHGEPDLALDLRLQLPDIIRNLGGINEDGAFTFTYNIDEWTQHLDHGTLTLTTNPDNPLMEETTTLNSWTDPVGPAYEDTATINLVHGTLYELTLQATDAAGDHHQDTATFISDTQPPTITTTLPADIHTNADSLTLEWTLHDDAAGLHLAILDGTCDDGDWETVTTWTYPNTTTPQLLSVTIPLDAYSTGFVLWCILHAQDKLGNTHTSTHKIHIDRALPTLTGTILDVVNGFITEPYLNTTVTLDDPTSGLDTARIWLTNHTTNTDHVLYDNNNLNGHRNTLTIEDTFTPWPNTTYTLHATATDQAGNTRTVELTTANVQIIPDLFSIVPNLTYQTVHDALRINATTHLPGYPDVKVDEAQIYVTRTSDNTRTDLTTLTNVLGEFDTTWNTATTGAGSYTLTLHLQHGTAVRYRNHTVNVTTTTTPDLQDYQNYGQLLDDSDYDQYRLEYDGCDGELTLRLQGYLKDVDLYVTPGEPSTAGTDHTTYTHAHDTTDTTETHHETSVTTGTVYTLLVRQKATDLTQYALTYHNGCSDGGGGGSSNDPGDIRDDIYLQ